MQPTAVEKLTLQMLCQIYKKLGITDSFDPDLISRAIGSGDYWVLDWAYDIRDEGQSNPQRVTAVVNALDMYSFLQDSFDGLSDEEQAAVLARVPNAEHRLKFLGFDGNNEPEYRSVARYLVDDLDRFESMRGVASANSHMPMAERYARMFVVFEPIRATLSNRLMTSDEIIRVLLASDALNFR